MLDVYSTSISYKLDFCCLKKFRSCKLSFFFFDKKGIKVLDLLVDLVVTLPEARSMVPLRDPKDLRLLSFRQASPFKRA